MKSLLVTEQLDALEKILDGNRQIDAAMHTVLWEEERTYDRLGRITGHLAFWDAAVGQPYGRPGGSCFVLTMLKTSSDNSGNDCMFEKVTLEDGMCIEGAIDAARFAFDKFVERSIQDELWQSRG